MQEALTHAPIVVGWIVRQNDVGASPLQDRIERHYETLLALRRRRRFAGRRPATLRRRRRTAVFDEPAVEAGRYFRSNQLSFGIRGVPAITFRAGRDRVDGGTAKGAALVAGYNARRRHQPSDAFMPSWTVAGTAQEATVAFDLGRRVANGGDWPAWYAGSEYAALRATMDALRSARR